MKILRYTPAIQKQLDCKVKAEPWLHIALFDFNDDDDDRHGVGYAVYVWDTRKVLSSPFAKQYDITCKDINGQSAVDNHQPLSFASSTWITDEIKDKMEQLRDPAAYKAKKDREQQIGKAIKAAGFNYDELYVRGDSVSANKMVKAYGDGYDDNLVINDHEAWASSRLDRYLPAMRKIREQFKLKELTLYLTGD